MSALLLFRIHGCVHFQNTDHRKISDYPQYEPLMASTDTWVTVGGVYCWNFINLVIRRPLEILYRRGPSLGNWAFWENKSAAEICAALTNVDASFWNSSPASWTMCERLIENKTDAFVLGTLGTTLGLTAALLLVCLMLRCVVVQPMVNAIAHSGRQCRHTTNA
jgi:hypothetical protein